MQTLSCKLPTDSVITCKTRQERCTQENVLLPSVPLPKNTTCAAYDDILDFALRLILAIFPARAHFVEHIGHGLSLLLAVGAFALF